MALTLHGNNGVGTTNGTAAAPSLVGADSDTGLFFGTNLIHASTDGTERLRISSGGAVQVNGGAVHLDANGELAVFETDTNLAFTNSSKLCFDFSSNVARIRSSKNGSATIRPIAIYTGNDERLRINSDGNTQFGGLAHGGNYQDGYARNVIDLGSATLNRGIGWGGSTANYANIWTEYSTGDLNLGQGVRPKGGNTGWFSSYGGGSIGRGVINFDMSTGDIRFYNAASSTVAAGSSVSTPEKLRITSAGKVLIGSTSARVESNGFASPLQVEGTATATSSVIIARNSANASSSQLIFQKSRGTSVGSNTVIQSGDAVGTIIFEGSDGTNTDPLASIIGACDGTPGTNDVPGRLVFSTTADGAASPEERLRIDSVGRVIIGATTVAPANSYSNNLVVSEASGDVGMQFVGNNSNSNYASLYFGDAGAASRAYFESKLGSNGNFTIGVNGTGSIRFNSNTGEKIRIDSGGRLLIGATTTRAQAGGNAMLQIEKNSSEGLSLLRTSNDSGAIWLALSKSRSSAGTVCQAGDHIGAIGFYPHDGTDLNHASADIRSYVESGIQGNDTPGDLRFHTNPGQTTTVERLRIDSRGCVRVGNTATESTSSNTKRIALGAKGSIQGWTTGNLNGLIQLVDNYYWDGSNNKAIEADHCAYLSLRSGSLRFGATSSSQTAGQNVSGGITERFRITTGGKIGLNYAGTPPSEDVMICASGQAAPAAASLSHLSSGNRYGTRFSTISGTNSGVIVYTQYNSSYIERQRIAGDGNTYFYDHNTDARLVMESDGDFKVSNPGWGTTSSPSTSSFQGLSQLGHQHWGHRQYYSKQFNLSQNGTQDLISNNTAHDDIIFWLNVKGYHSNRTFAAVHGTIGGYGITYHSQHGASGAAFTFTAHNIASGRNALRFTSTSSWGAQWWVWGWISGTAGTGTHTGMTAKQLH